MSNTIDLTSLSAEELIKLIAEKEALIAEKDSHLADSESYINELKEDLQSKESEISTIGGNPTVTYGKDTYMVAIPNFSFDGEKYTTADLLADNKLVASLVKIGSGVLVKVEKASK